MDILIVGDSENKVSIVEQIRKLDNLVISDFSDSPKEDVYTISRTPIELVEPKFF